MKKRMLLAALSAGVLLTAGQVATSTAQPTAITAVKWNGFERPAHGTAYTLSQWSTDGWNAPWSEGLDSRSMIDSSTTAHSGTKSLRIFYPKGKIGPADSGAQAPFTLTKAREYYVSQWIRLSSTFSWGTTQYAGKIGVGLRGGAGCSGGTTCTGYNGFTSRLIWRSSGQAAIYYYHMDQTGTYGDYRNLTKASGEVIKYPRGAWLHVAQKVRVNTVTNGNANPDGEIEVWYNGVSAAKITGLRFVRNADLVDSAMFSSFAGGATAEFAPANDSWIWYDTLKVSTNRAEICEISGGC